MDMKGKTVWGKKLLGGYPGVKHTAKQIVEAIPNINKYNLWVEPFSGLGRTAQYVDIPKVLNDKSIHANEFCKENFINSIVENMDFMETINKYDSEDTFFLIDPPWRFDVYDDRSLSVCDRKPYDYYKELLEKVDTIKADWFILSSANEREQKKILQKSKWNTRIVSSEGKVIFGKHARTMVCSNLFNKDNWENIYCKFCGHVNDIDDDGDRYFYTCPDMNCKFWSQNG